MEIYTVGYSSKMLKNKLLAFAVSDMNLKSIVQSEKFRHEEIHIEWSHLHEMSKKGQLYKDKTSSSDCLRLSVGKGDM